jgi:hypothetical protein
MDNRILALNDFKAKAQQKDAEQAKRDEARTIQEIVQLSVEIYRRLLPGTALLVDVKTGKIVIPGRTAGDMSGCLFVSKPAAMIRTAAQVDLAAGGDLPPSENPPKGGDNGGVNG